MQIEMTIKGLMVDPITSMPIIILRDSDGHRGTCGEYAFLRPRLQLFLPPHPSYR